MQLESQSLRISGGDTAGPYRVDVESETSPTPAAGIEDRARLRSSDCSRDLDDLLGDVLPFAQGTVIVDRSGDSVTISDADDTFTACGDVQLGSTLTHVVRLAIDQAVESAFHSVGNNRGSEAVDKQAGKDSASDQDGKSVVGRPLVAGGAASTPRSLSLSEPRHVFTRFPSNLAKWSSRSVHQQSSIC